MIQIVVLLFVCKGPPGEWIRGNASNVPFWPGGLEWNPSETMSDLLKMDELLDELSFKKGKEILVQVLLAIYIMSLLLTLDSDLKTVPPGFQNGMNFGSNDVNLSLASSLKPKSKRNETEEVGNMIEADDTSVIDLADLLKEKGSIFKWIEEEPSAPQEKKGEF